MLPETIQKAIIEGSAATVSDWIAAGGAINACDAKGRTALMLAATQGRMLIVQMLLDAGADLDLRQSHGASALQLVCFSGDARIITQLLVARSNARMRDGRGLMALNYATLRVRPASRRIAQAEHRGPRVCIAKSRALTRLAAPKHLSYPHRPTTAAASRRSTSMSSPSWGNTSMTRSGVDGRVPRARQYRC